MATHPTKDQRKASELLAGSLATIAEAARSDGRGVPDADVVGRDRLPGVPRVVRLRAG